jgi:hypothetical protein
MILFTHYLKLPSENTCGVVFSISIILNGSMKYKCHKNLESSSLWLNKKKDTDARVHIICKESCALYKKTSLAAKSWKRMKITHKKPLKLITAWGHYWWVNWKDYRRIGSLQVCVRAVRINTNCEFLRVTKNGLNISKRIDILEKVDQQRFTRLLLAICRIWAISKSPMSASTQNDNSHQLS